ncbi:hypothetical protein MKW94_016447, partial [Papaver nudicaule]|nr:hypothetical protein [Papaver nudicaule]
VARNQQGEPHCTRNSLEEEEEQFSPVSVLEPQFDDEDGEEEEDGQEDDDDYDDDGSEMERSFASVHRARQQLLQKLRRFERLAELDPVELEKRIADDDSDDDSEDETASENCRGDSLVRQLVVETSLCTIIDGRIPSDMKRLVLDLKTQVESEQESPSDDREMNKLIRDRLDSWKEVESNTIDMMVELDFRSEGDRWRKCQEQVKETAIAIEFDIFSYLITELSEELVHQNCH